MQNMNIWNYEDRIENPINEMTLLIGH